MQPGPAQPGLAERMLSDGKYTFNYFYFVREKGSFTKNKEFECVRIVQFNFGLTIMTLFFSFFNLNGGLAEAIRRIEKEN